MAAVLYPALFRLSVIVVSSSANSVFVRGVSSFAVRHCGRPAIQFATPVRGRYLPVNNAARVGLQDRVGGVGSREFQALCRDRIDVWRKLTLTPVATKIFPAPNRQTRPKQYWAGLI